MAAPMLTTAPKAVPSAVRDFLSQFQSQTKTRGSDEVRADRAALLAHLFRPCLHFVKHFAPGEEPQRVDRISIADALSLRAWYTKEEPTDDEAVAAQRVLGLGNQCSLWVECSCRPDVPMDPPVLSCIEIRRGSGVYTPRRRMDRTPHAWFCFFRFDRVAKLPDEASTSEDGARENIDLLRGHGVREAPVRRQARAGQAEVGASNSQLSITAHAALMSILKGAGCTRISATRSSRGEVASIERYAAGVRHRWNQTLTLAKCLHVNPSRPDDPELVRVIFRSSAGLWPKGELAVAYVLMVASEVFKHEDGSCSAVVETIQGWRRNRFGRAFPLFARTRVKFDCPVSVAEPAGECGRAPYILFLRAEMSVEGKPMWIDGVAQPISSRSCWVPVHSIPEREAVSSIRAVTAELDAAGIQHHIVKRVGTIKNDVGETCEPDFVATRTEDAVDHKQLLLETQKTASQTYHDRKVKQHRIMNDIGMLYIDDRLKYSKAVADSKLRERLRRFYGLDGQTGSDAAG